MRLNTFLKEIVDDSSGATAVEYGLIVTLIVIAMIASLNSVANSTISMWSNVSTTVTEASS